jgi:photosystem II stability/assembly factor-like uncharacterized protein
MKRLIPTVLFVFICALSGSAQKWVEMMEDEKVNFYDVQKEFYKFYEGHTPASVEEGESEEEMDGPYTRFKRWEYYMEPRVYPTGIRPDEKAVQSAWEKQKLRIQNTNALSRTAAANWTFVGPSAIPSNGGGAGKVNAIAIDPLNTQNIYLGTSGGGVWRSTNGGNTWNTTTDYQLPSLVVLDIAIDPVTPNKIFIALLRGVYVSTDAGISWSSTSINQNTFRVEIDPNNHNVIICACTDGMYRSSDGGASWTQVFVSLNFATRMDDIEFNPGNSNIVYACGFMGFYRSTDNGLTWVNITAGIPTSPLGIKLAVSPANPSYVYALFSGYNGQTSGGFYALCRSTDAGLNWTTMSSSPNILGYDPSGLQDGGQGPYCMSLAVSPLNAEEVYAGGINLWKSVDGGTNWTNLTDGIAGTANYVHFDQQDLKFQPGSGTTLYSCNDGGMNVSTDGGSTWTDQSGGLQIMELYKLSSSATNPDLIVTGSQDNGTNKQSSSGLTRINYGDGFKCIVDYTDSNTIYTSYQNGVIFKSTDGGLNNTYISPTQSSIFMTNYTMNPVKSSTLYTAFDEVYKTSDAGQSWTAISSGLYAQMNGGFNIPVVVAPSDTNTIYVARVDQLFCSNNDGATWNTLTTGISPLAYVTGITVDPLDKNNVWIAYSGYNSYSESSNERVFKTEDGGLTWINITYSGLPAVPINCIVYQNGSPDGVYVGTDIGVYYLDNTMASWVPYTIGLPNVRVMDLEIQYSINKLRAATYGRGIWETDLYVPVVQSTDAGVELISEPVGTICIDTISPVVRIKNFGTNVLTSATINYQVDAGPVYTYNWSGAIASFASATVALPSIAVAGLSHQFKVYSVLPNGNADQNSLNDSAFSTFEYPVGIALPYSEGFEDPNFPPSGMEINNPDAWITWRRTTNAAYTGSASAYIEDFNYYNDGMIDEMILPYFNFNSLTPNMTFKYAYQLNFEPQPINYYSDTLSVYVSVDCGNTWTMVYRKYDLPLVTTTPVFNNVTPFVPGSQSDWASEYIDLSAFTNNDKVLIKIQNSNGRGNNLYVDDINIANSPVGVQSLSRPVIQIYPNPNDGVFSFTMTNGKPGSVLNVFNVLGKLVYSTKIIGGTNSIDLGDKSSGIYFYEVLENDVEVANGKLILK